MTTSDEIRSASTTQRKTSSHRPRQRMESRDEGLERNEAAQWAAAKMGWDEPRSTCMHGLLGGGMAQTTGIVRGTLAWGPW